MTDIDLDALEEIMKVFFSCAKPILERGGKKAKRRISTQIPF